MLHTNPDGIVFVSVFTNFKKAFDSAPGKCYWLNYQYMYMAQEESTLIGSSALLFLQGTFQSYILKLTLIIGSSRHT